MVELQTRWGWLLAVDLFCSGLAAGAFLVVGIVMLLTGDRFKSTVRFGAWASVVAVVTGVIFLLLDVGVPFRAIVLFKSFVRFDSWMTRGAWLLFSAILFYGLFALFSTDRVVEWAGKLWRPLKAGRKVFQIVLAVAGILISVGVAGYTGMLMSVLPFRPLWNTWLLPALFASSALLTGAILVGGYASLREKADGVKKLRLGLEAAVITVIALEGAALWFYLTDRLNGGADAARSAQLLTSGPLALFFWILVVGLGLAVPLAMCIAQLSGAFRKAPAAIPALAPISCLIGGWTLRFLILLAGLPASLSSPGLQQILQGVRFTR